jgi:hypothetical protein
MPNITTVNPQLPAYLSAFSDIPSSFDNIVGGILTGGHPKLSIKSSRFRLVLSKDEQIVWNGFEINVVLVDGNPVLSKRWYSKPFDNDVIVSPDCYSDNGVSPDKNAKDPQAAVCAMCPKNEWGSRVNADGSTSKGKACAESKRLAVMIIPPEKSTIAFDWSTVYELSVPATSLKSLSMAVKSVADRGIPIPAMQFTISFDPNTSYPELMFEATGYISPKQAALVKAALGTPEVARAIGTIAETAAVEKPVLPIPSPSAEAAPPKPVEVAKPKAAPRAAKAAPVAPPPIYTEQPPLPFAPYEDEVTPPVKSSISEADASLEAELDALFGSPDGK